MGIWTWTHSCWEMMSQITSCQPPRSPASLHGTSHHVSQDKVFKAGVLNLPPETVHSSNMLPNLFSPLKTHDYKLTGWSLYKSDSWLKEIPASRLFLVLLSRLSRRKICWDSNHSPAFQNKASSLAEYIEAQSIVLAFTASWIHLGLVQWAVLE